MKFIRSSKCSLKFSTNKKRSELEYVLNEYSKVVNFFIEYFWNKEKLDKGSLLKPIVDLPQETTWLSARLRKVAARESIDMILASRERWKNKPDKMKKPTHKGDRIYCSSTIADLQESNSSFDCYIRLTSIGNKIKLELPIKKHKQFNKWESKGKRLNSYVITKNYIQFSFEMEVDKKKTEGKTIGIDTGIKCLATTSENQRIGDNIENIIESIKRCKQGSKRQNQLRLYLKHYINTCAKEVFKQNPRLQRIVVERLKNMNFKTKTNRKIGKGLRKSIGNWNYRYWLDRIQRECEENRVCFTSVNPMYTSQSCNQCGHTDRTNRSKQDTFKCVNCGHTDHADHNAAKNILDLGVSLVYRRGK
jgi:IS605 OrfB family transposase